MVQNCAPTSRSGLSAERQAFANWAFALTLMPDRHRTIGALAMSRAADPRAGRVCRADAEGRDRRPTRARSARARVVVVARDAMVATSTGDRSGFHPGALDGCGSRRSERRPLD